LIEMVSLNGEIMEDNIPKRLELYLQSIVSQLVKIEKDMRGIQETGLCELIAMVEMNRLTLKTLQVQFNVFMKNPSTGVNQLELEMDDELEKLKERVAKYKESIKKVSSLLSLPSPEGNGEVSE